jgi:hypothetical protein
MPFSSPSSANGRKVGLPGKVTPFSRQMSPVRRENRPSGGKITVHFTPGFRCILQAAE